VAYTLGNAAKATGKSKPTIQRAIKTGRISALKKGDGSYEIDPSELHRVFPPLPLDGQDLGTLKQSVMPDVPTLLQAQLEGVRGELEQVKSERDDLRRRLDTEAEERRRLTAILTDQSPTRRPWWRVWK
jgi:excisionase family DNA binding protein